MAAVLERLNLVLPTQQTEAFHVQACKCKCFRDRWDGSFVVVASHHLLTHASPSN